MDPKNLARIPTTPEQTALAIAYRNPDKYLIADDVMPRTPSVDSRSFKYTVYDEDSGYTVADDRVGATGELNQVSSGGRSETAFAEDHGLKDSIANEDIEAGRKAKKDEVNRSIEHILGVVTLNREVRVAGIAGNADNYNAGCVDTLSGTDQWDHADSDPSDYLSDALERPLMRPNAMGFSWPVWNKLRKNAKLILAIRQKATGGALSRQEVADHFELERILVGRARVNGAKKGQPMNLTPCWGNFAFLHYNDPGATTKNGITWGFTVPYLGRVAGSEPDSKIGMRGGVRVVAGESLAEVPVAPDCGLLIQNPLGTF